MSSALVDVDQPADWDRFDVQTTLCDGPRAVLRAMGRLDHATANLLADVLSSHLRAHRRYLRLEVSGLSVAEPDALAVIADVHQRLLSARGTLILTGVTTEFMGTLAEVGLDRQLFTVQPLACDVAAPLIDR
jgi:anti-anti-sigma regulatory factor